jgi:hypothetical protein
MKTRIKFRSCSKRAKWVIYPTAWLVVANFFAFVAGSLYLGGDALNGFIRAGHHFLCAHGACVEVSQAVWRYSYWHAITAIGGILLVVAEAALFLNTGDIDFE